MRFGKTEKYSFKLIQIMMKVKPIYPCLWFEGNNATEAARYYCSVFEDSGILQENPMAITFELNGMKFMGLNGRRDGSFSDTVSFVIECETQAEIDYYWDALGEGGMYRMCGWLKDKFGVSWQIVPSVLSVLMANPEKRERVLHAFLKMTKFDIEGLVGA